MKITIITLFPASFEPILNSSILKRAQTKGKVIFKLINLRDFGEGKHQVVDDRPYGGGTGMILRADILAKSLKSLTDYRLPTTAEDGRRKTESKTILMSASGTPYKQKKAQELSKLDHLIIVCGHYEGVDQRFIDKYVMEEISIGDYVLTGGEIPAMVIADSIVRLIPGVLEKLEAIENESFSDSSLITDHLSLEYPQYTRPDNFEGLKVPEILLSGHHGEIEKWRKLKSLEKTRQIRPELITNFIQKD